jgi:hypothetical protein
MFLCLQIILVGAELLVTKEDNSDAYYYQIMHQQVV